MSRDFSHKNLRGLSFQGQDLTGADFSFADIRGTDFTGASLRQTNFSHTIAGLPHRWRLLLIGFAFILSAISGFASAFSGVIAVDFIFFAVKRGFEFTLVAGLMALVTLTVFCVLTTHQGLEVALGASAVVGAIAVAIAGVTSVDGVIAGSVAGVLVAVNIAAALALAVAFTMSVTLTRRVAAILALLVVIVGAVAGISLGVAVAKSPEAITSAVSVAVSSIVIEIVLGVYLAKQVLTRQKFTFLHSIAVALAAIGGTSFREADLIGANFTQAKLKNTDLRKAKLTHTNFHRARKLEQARVGDTILNDPNVRDLVVTKRGTHKSYISCNLKGANLAGADLNYANLTEADVSEATFEGAWLEQANLTKIQALKTNFSQAKLTGACLEGWNIDNTTQLQEVNCDYVYLLSHQKERRPSSGNFAPGDFTKLFQEVVHTVDFIFRNGIDWKAFIYSFQQLQIENEGTRLSVRSVENKGDGVFVVRVDVPADVNKEKIHGEFIQHYQLSLKTLEERYQAELKSKDKQIEDWKEFAQLLANRPVNIQLHQRRSEEKFDKSKLVVFKLGKGDFNIGFPVTLQIGEEGTSPEVEFTGELPSIPTIPKCYTQWQSAYRRSLNTSFRLDVPETQITNVSKIEFLEECEQTAENLRKHLNLWLNSQQFRPVKERILEKLNPSETIRIIVQTENSLLRRLPWTLWDLCDRYPKAEIALSTSAYERIKRVILTKRNVRILAILGDSTGIDVRQDQAVLQQLPNTEITFLVEPQRMELNDQLWKQPWDILFFAGHSLTQTDKEIGLIRINKTDILTISQLKNSLRKAIEQGLQLAIFNSCDSLGLAVNLADLHIPQMIVMREPVPDKVAQEFLKNFLAEYSRGKFFYQAVRAAREKLQGIEDKFPCASWLPVICQNPAEVPPLWEDLR